MQYFAFPYWHCKIDVLFLVYDPVLAADITFDTSSHRLSWVYNPNDSYDSRLEKNQMYIRITSTPSQADLSSYLVTTVQHYDMSDVEPGMQLIVYLAPLRFCGAAPEVSKTFVVRKFHNNLTLIFMKDVLILSNIFC